MKKEYAKPFLAVESFQLDAALAGACTDKYYQLNHDIESCVNDEAPFVFGDACDPDMVNNPSYDPGENNGICYQAFETSFTDQFLTS